jgi:hypothetical protein
MQWSSESSSQPKQALFVISLLYMKHDSEYSADMKYNFYFVHMIELPMMMIIKNIFLRNLYFLLKKNNLTSNLLLVSFLQYTTRVVLC